MCDRGDCMLSCVQGGTVHSFAGVGLGMESAVILARKVNANKRARERWVETETLVIDEVRFSFIALGSRFCVIRWMEIWRV